MHRRLPVTVALAFMALLIVAASPAPAKRTPAEVTAENARTIATLFEALTAPEAKWSSIVFHHSATAGGSKKRFDAGHAKKFGDPDGMEYHFLIGSGVGTEDGLIEVGGRWPRQIIAYHLFTHARDEGSLAICFVGNFELDGKRPTKAQMAAAAALGAALVKRYGIAEEAITTHRGIDGRLTQCPGKNFPLLKLRSLILGT